MKADALRTAAAELADRLVLGPRLGKKSIAGIKDAGVRTIWCLLAPREQTDALKRLATKNALDWVETPLDGGRLEVPETVDLKAVPALILALAEAGEDRVYLHCSAGLHRTGFMAALVLTLAGVEENVLPDRLRALREVTADEVGPDRIALAARRARDML
jgi:protein tyrosine/serine phosphatase